jgi:4a-hydroxytetrahydrobiopterin dehydratase
MTLDDYGDSVDPTGGGDPDKRRLSGHEVSAELLGDWRTLFEDELQARFTTDDFASALDLVDAIGAAAQAADHHPDVRLSWGRVDVTLSSHDVGGVTQRDVRLAREISELAGARGARASSDTLSVLELALDSPDAAAIRPFWAAVLGYDLEGAADEVVDPTGVGPSLWFQESESSDPHHEMRFHLDVRVPHEVAEQRVKAALDAGGTLVSDGRAPAFWVLADAQDNKACITTWLGRSDG